MFDLVFKCNDKRFDNSRWSLFDWMFDFGLDFIRSAKAVHKKYFAVLITIQYLLKVILVHYIFNGGSKKWNLTHEVTSKLISQQEEITIDEADAILITEEYVRDSRTRQDRGDRIEKMNTHFIRLAHLYTKMYNLICHCLEVCGLFPFTVCFCNSPFLLFIQYFYPFFF